MSELRLAAWYNGTLADEHLTWEEIDWLSTAVLDVIASQDASPLTFSSHGVLQ